MCEHTKIRKDVSTYRYCSIHHVYCEECNQFLFDEQLGSKEDPLYYEKFNIRWDGGKE